MPGILLYVSAHGYGHATRMVALVDSLRRLEPTLPVYVRTEAPHWLFTDDHPSLCCSAAPIDVGMLQRNCLDLDLAASLRSHEAFVEGWDEAVEREARFLSDLRPALVVADVPPLAPAAASKAGIPAFLATNFTWDWIIEPWIASQPRWRPVRDRYAAAYARARGLFRLPFAGDFRVPVETVDVPLLVRRSRLSRPEARRRLRIDPGERRPVILVSFGGLGSAELGFEAVEDLSGFIFIGFSPKPPGMSAEWREFPRHSPSRHVDLLAACDVLVGKPGYGTMSEALAHKIRLLYVPREGFREAPVLVERFLAWGCGRALPRGDFLRGAWRSHLESLLRAPATFAEIGLDGADVLAGSLLARLNAAAPG